MFTLWTGGEEIVDSSARGCSEDRSRTPPSLFVSDSNLNSFIDIWYHSSGARPAWPYLHEKKYDLIAAPVSLSSTASCTLIPR
jgi:hypothetical protein